MYGDGVGEVALVVEALRWWWLWRRRRGSLHARERRCPAPLKMKGKKRGNDLSEAFLGALGTVRAMAVGWLVCAHDACEGGCSRWLACPQRVTWQRL